jgi:hypothetical protein
MTKQAAVPPAIPLCGRVEGQGADHGQAPQVDRSSWIEEPAQEGPSDGATRSAWLVRARAVALKRRIARRASAPACSEVVCYGRGAARSCNRTLVQNEVGRERQVWWCPRCTRYTDGSHGLPQGHSLRAEAAGFIGWAAWPRDPGNETRGLGAPSPDGRGL